MLHLEDIPARKEGFISREIGDETILISGDGKKMHTLDSVGSFIWNNIDGRNSIDILIGKICDEYEVDRISAEKDLLIFIDSLMIKELVILR